MAFAGATRDATGVNAIPGERPTDGVLLGQRDVFIIITSQWRQEFRSPAGRAGLSSLWGHGANLTPVRYHRQEGR